jgi:hypothetical protein
LGANVIQVIMESAANCVKARRLVHQQFPHITPAPCAAHCIDLALEDICKLAHVKELHDKLKTALQFVRNHDRLLAEFRKDAGKKIIIPGNTHFKCVYIMFSRAMEVKSALRKNMSCDAFEDLLTSCAQRSKRSEEHRPR